MKLIEDSDPKTLIRSPCRKATDKIGIFTFFLCAFRIMSAAKCSYQSGSQSVEFANPRSYSYMYSPHMANFSQHAPIVLNV